MAAPTSGYMNDFGADQIRIGEAIERSLAHLAVACELYGMGRKPDALLQAARPITDILPALETELRSAADALTGFFTATARVGSEIRANAKPRALRRALTRAEESASELQAAAFGEQVAENDTFRSSVAVALLEGVPDRYRGAVEDENLGDFQASYAIVDRATEIIWSVHDGRIESLTELASGLSALLPAAEPPDRLPSPDAVETLVAGVVDAAGEHLGAVAVRWTVSDSAAQMERLLADVVDAYDKDLGPLAARLASSLFVRAYDPVRREIAAGHPDAEARLTSLLGFELRRAINDSVPNEQIRTLADEARGLLATLRTHPATHRETSDGPG